MANEKEIIDLCSSDEEEEDFGDCEIVDLQDLDETEEEEDDDDDSNFSENDDDSDWINDDDDAMESDVEVDEDDETREKGNDGDVDDDKVTRLLTAGSDLKALNLIECKSYLRKHGLRLSGTKAVCIDRIVEHWRIKDGTGEAAYPRSSFTINCKGDVCKGDTVLFTQKVPQKSGKIIGRRTVAGSVVKESYGTAKQQHTFTIEVLWCEGIQKLPPLYPLLVKGRNLYRLMTIRQRWANEDERVKVLSEKHSRGAAARKVMRERKIKLGYVFKDGRLQKPGHVKKKPCQVKTRKTNNNEPNHSSAAFTNQNPSQGHKNPTQRRNMNQPFPSYATSRPLAPLPVNVPRPYAPFDVPRPSIPPSHSYAYSTQQNQSNHRPPQTVSNASHLPRRNVPPSHSYSYPVQQTQSNQRPPQAFYDRRPTSNAPQGQAYFNPHAMPVTYQRRPYQNHHHSYHVARDLDHFSDMMISHRREGDAYRQSEDNRRSHKNHYTARDLGMVSHRTERDPYRPNHRP